MYYDICAIVHASRCYISSALHMPYMRHSGLSFFRDLNLWYVQTTVDYVLKNGSCPESHQRCSEVSQSQKIFQFCSRIHTALSQIPAVLVRPA